MHIIDNFLNDNIFIKQMEEDDSFWEMGYKWWSGWWSNTGKDNRHKLIEEIWCHKCPKEFNKLPLDGFEHWVGVHKPGENIETIGKEKFSLGPHVDKDEGLWESGKKVSNPLIGTIYYIKAPEEGGYLKIYDNDEEGSFQLIKPVVDRLVIFNAGKLHAITEVLKGERKAIAINLWDKKPTTEMVETY
jgi:hypothetical protein